MKQNFTYKGLARLYFIMRVSLVNLILLVTSCLQVLSASPVNGQNMRDTFVSINVEHVPLKKVFKIIEDQTGLLFVYPPALVEPYNDVTLEDSRISVRDILLMTLNDLPIEFKESEGNILLFRTVASESEATVQSVSGKVIELSTGTGLPGVSVIIKGTTTGTTTDAEGRFAIDARANDVLVFSSVGFKNQEIDVGGRTIIDIQMEDDISSLNEVVINGGYYKTTSETKVGNIVRVSEKEIRNQPVTSPLLALQGRAAGVDVSPASGVPGGSVNITIRGKSSLRFDGGYPLYVIDGVPVDSSPVPSSGALVVNDYDPLSALNPSNIESIEILKDADATSIYGSRGANGVVLITTKRASEGRTSADFNMYRGVGQLAKKMDMLNTQQYLAMRREAFKNNNNQAMTEFNAPDLLVWDTTRYTDWQDVLMGGTADVTDLQAGFSGGNSNTSFRLSGGYHKETTIFPGDFYFQRFTGSFSLRHASRNNKFRATISANYGDSKNQYFNAFTPVPDALNLPPNAPELYSEDGGLNWEFNSGAPTWNNPLSEYKKTNDAKSGNLMFNSTLNYDIGKGFVGRVNMGFNNLNAIEIIKTPVSSYNPNDVPYVTAESIYGNTMRRSWIVEPQLQFLKRFDNHGLDVLIGTTFQQGSSDVKQISAQGYASDALLGSLQAASTTRVFVDENGEYRYAALFARIGYDWKEKYFINLTGRRDGSSRFGANNRFGNFGSIGGAWIFSNEKLFLDNLSFISFGKLRGSIGTTGNDQIGDYKYLDTYSVTPNKYHGVVGLLPTSLFNPGYKWEVNKKLEAAAELAFIDNRFSIEVAWYRNRSSNQLMDYQLPGTTGFGSIFKNFDATIENRGLEYTLNLNLVTKGDFRWNTSVNYSSPRNKLVRFDNIENSPYSDTYIVGESLSMLKFYKYTGVNPETGIYTFLDVDSDGGISDVDRTLVMNVGGVYFGGVNNTFSYKGIELSFLFQFVKQTAIAYQPATTPGKRFNIPKYIYDNRWIKSGDVADRQKISTSNSLNAPNFRNGDSDHGVVSSSFLRLKTLSLSYRFPSGLTDKIRLQNCSIYLQGQNIFTITEFTGLDPETGTTAIPPLRMISLGIQLGI